MRLIILIIGLLTFLSCQKEDGYIQDIVVNRNLYLSEPEYSDLQAVGNYMFINNEGVKGLIVYHKSFSTYKVYDRSCTYQPSLANAKIDSINASIAICSQCNSMFLMDEDGISIKAPALLPLKEYSNTLSGDVLHIYN